MKGKMGARDGAPSNNRYLQVVCVVEGNSEICRKIRWKLLELLKMSHDSLSE